MRINQTAMILLFIITTNTSSDILKLKSYRTILLLDKLLPTDKESLIIKIFYTHTYKLEIKKIF